MEIGVVFPTLEIGTDPMAIRDFAQAVDDLGFTHLLVYDHVLGADPNRPGGWSSPYDKDTAIHEPFVLFGYLAGVTRRIELVTTVLVLTQRQTALVAKQAAEVDILSGGRLRLGVGTGWNRVEYEALGVDFGRRGARQEEQIRLMRELWTKDSVDFHGEFHDVSLASINPRPKRSIPVWLGGRADPVLRRAARMADGWMPLGSLRQEAESLEKLPVYLAEEGRDPAGFGIQAQAQAKGGTPERWQAHVSGWRDAGCTHMALATMRAGFERPDQHINAARRFAEATGDKRS